MTRKRIHRETRGSRRAVARAQRVGRAGGPSPRRSGSRRAGGPDAEETKAHVLAAARELLLAAQGALKFCRYYVEETSQSKTKPYLVGFFQKATQVANELGKGILDACPATDVAKGAVKTVIESIGREMEIDAKKPSRSKAHGKKKARRNAR